MLVKDKKHFIWGLVLAVSFLAILAVMFSPVFHGENALRAADRLFNSIAKGSTYYLPDLFKGSEKYRTSNFEASLRMPGDEIATKAMAVLSKAEIDSSKGDSRVKVTGNLGLMMEAALRDAEAMFNNQGNEIAQKYGYHEKEVLYIWWKIFKEVEQDFKKQKKFTEAAFVGEVIKKGIEVGYNFYGIEPQKASGNVGILSFSLVFYVIYTLWWGLAILFLFEGFGLQMKAGAKKEV